MVKDTKKIFNFLCRGEGIKTGWMGFKYLASADGGCLNLQWDTNGFFNFFV